MAMITPHTVGDIMTRDVVTVDEDDTLENLAEAMRRMHFRHMPVLDGTNLVGLITERLLLSVSASTLLPAAGEQTRALSKRFHVRDVMIESPKAVSADTPIDEAAEIMVKDKLGCLPVVTQENRLIGIITEADFVKLALLRARMLSS